ncbi:RagB/SusD family nutrient uptake outer membrane protein, partial [Bacteroides caccae]
ATDNEFRMSACAAINKVRQRSDVQMPDFPDNISNTEFWERYKKERMVELAFEQHRFWDVRRWKEGGFTKIGRMQITQKEDGNFLYERTNKSLVWDDKMYFFPIPASEMRKNPNLSQNPGW